MDAAASPRLGRRSRFHIRSLAAIAAVVAALVVGGLRVAPAEATFHISQINEVMFGAGGDGSLQYVEIKMLAPGQNLVHNTRLSAWNADGSFFGVLLLVPTDVPNGNDGGTWIMGTADLQATTGMKPDFTFAPVTLPATGMICWGAPGLITPDPSTWDPSNPLNYVDCLPYGGYSGANIRNAPATPLALGDGSLSLTRVASTTSTAMNYALQCPTPTNNSMATAEVGPDTDGDGYVDCAETALGKSPTTFCKVMRADVNWDGKVNLLDLGAVAAFFGQSVPPAPARYQQAPFDNKVNLLDLGTMASVFGQSVMTCP